MTNRQLVMTKMCLNNWHYIDEKVLFFHENINFFTGHSGSGKSTVLDALQVVLYADSNGRGFFNKAAKEDSDRTLIEYLRGMKVVKENNEATYLRNQNFSTTIVLEFMDSETKNCQCIGIVFDVDVSTNDYNRLFFWHKGEMPECRYRKETGVFSINELKAFLKENYSLDEFNFNNTNEKFRAKLYQDYFGGLNEKTFPALFKKAIPFKMNMKLEDFVKEYICTEHDIHIEDMKDSVSQYVRLRRRLEDTKQEIGLLQKVCDQFKQYQNYVVRSRELSYFMDKLDLIQAKNRETLILEEKEKYRVEMEGLKIVIDELNLALDELQKRRDAAVIAIENSDVGHLELQLKSLDEMLSLLKKNKENYDKLAERIAMWETTGILSDETISLIEQVKSYHADGACFDTLREKISNARKHAEEQVEKLNVQKAQLKKSADEISDKISKLKTGKKAYPKYITEAKDIIGKGLSEKFGKDVVVHIAADLIDVKEPIWTNAVEGYMGGNKLSIVVEPEYVKDAMELYRKMDKKRYSKISILDTKKVMERKHEVLENSLASYVDSHVPYMKAYLDFLLGNVIGCMELDEMKQHACAVTPDCLLYKGYQLKQLDPRYYTEFAFIGQDSIENHLLAYQEELRSLEEQLKPVMEEWKTWDKILSLESLNQETSVYEEYIKAICDVETKERQKKQVEATCQALREKKQVELIKGKEAIEVTMKQKQAEKEEVATKLHDRQIAIRGFEEELAVLKQDINLKEQAFVFDATKEVSFEEMMKEKGQEKFEKLKYQFAKEKNLCKDKAELEYQKLLVCREEYQKQYGYRGFSVGTKDNSPYDGLLVTLQSDKLNEYMDRAKEQGKIAIHHFKTDFIYKIRDAIKEVMQQQEELNRILSTLDFGKDKYRFVITKSQGEEGKFYDMFMDPNLEINPGALSNSMDNQVDLFSMEHEKEYHDLINELIELFMPPETDDQMALETARINMERYSDYRTYLHFDMEQLVDGMPPMRLSKMLSKNSGGEGQNPLYVALLASFAQVYHINSKSTLKRRPTPRMVVLDEAFSKMDAEKVGSCIGLIRSLGFQAIISATNDKIQNYVENVDKTFVFANPNKNFISIQEFERNEITQFLGNKEEV